ncbi:MAG: YiiX/YebB-like N1pC/P60 family cysteine hydrolase [Bacteroidales bacterium]|nr:YiiX/YebB-like N1pC/P60 family cysteine hydrolase [Bacteroidales bacterium]
MKNTSKIIFFSSIGILILLQAFYLYMKTYDYTSEIKRVKTNYRLTKSEIAMLQDGDIILRHGYGFVSDMIVETLKDNYDVSHCAIFVKDDSTNNVIHAVSQSLSEYDGVQIQSLRRFINDSKKNSVIVLRYKTKPNESHSAISERARYYLDKKIPFDSGFDIKDSTEFFCTELIWKVFLDAYNVDIYEGKYDRTGSEFLKFDIFFNPELFEVVFSHNPAIKPE